MTHNLTPTVIHTDSPAEAAVLGAMMLSKAFAQDAAAELGAEDFATPAHQTIFSAIQSILAAGKYADGVTVVEQLRVDGHLQEVGGVPFIHSLIEGSPTTEAAEHFLEIVRRTAILRGSRQESTTVVPMREALVETIEDMEYQHNQRRDVAGVPTGIPLLDLLTSGLQPGNLIVVASAPSAGKTTLVLDFARHAAIRASVSTLVCSLELSRKEITQRISAAECTIDLQRLRTGRMDESDWTRLTRSLGKLAELPLHIDDSVAFSVSTLRAKAKQLQRSRGLGLLVVDPIQALLPFRLVENLYEHVSYSVRGLKVIARELNIPVVATSQISRQIQMRSDRRPLLGDLRDSGALEDTADLIIFVYRDEMYDKETERRGEADLILAKQRQGPTDTVTVVFQGQYSRFAPLAPPSIMAGPDH
jgi:replicative DNA helicase